MKFKKIIYENLDSTNLEIKRNISNMDEFTVVIAKNQTKGRGRFGKSWESRKNLGVYMSILLKPNLDLDKLSFISLIAPLAVCLALEDFDVDASIKWPNDIILNNKKLGGILTESYIRQGQSYVISGIGLNINHDLKDISKKLHHKASSLKIEDGIYHDISLISDKILEEFYFLYNLFLLEGSQPIIKLYKRKSALLGKEVFMIKNNKKELIKVKDINCRGELVVLKNGRKLNLNTSEISIRGKDGYI